MQRGEGGRRESDCTRAACCPRSICRVHSCGTQAILNLILNIDDATASEHGIKLGEEIKNFKEFTQCLPADVSPTSSLVGTARNAGASMPTAHLAGFDPICCCVVFLLPQMRGEAISNSDLIRKAHNGFAR